MDREDAKFLGYVFTHAVKLPVTLNHEGYAIRLPNWDISLPFREPNKAVTIKVGESEAVTVPVVVRKRIDQPNICFAHSVLVGAITSEIFGTPFVIVDCHREVSIVLFIARSSQVSSSRVQRCLQ
jgi:hypothetical protein